MSHLVDAHVAYCEAIADLSRDKVELLERIKRLEEAGNAMMSEPCEYTFEQWIKAKEAKP